MFAFFIFLAILTLVSTHRHTIEEAEHIANICGKFPEFSNNTKSIVSVGGREADPREAPWAVAVRVDDRPYCSGSLISDRFVLLAAHCYGLGDEISFEGLTVNTLVENVQIMVDRANVAVSSFEPGEKAQLIKVKRTYTPMAYYKDNSRNGDIALIELETPVQFGEFTGPLCLPDEPSQLKTPLTLFGYGSNLVESKDAYLFKFETNLAECDERMTERRSDASCSAYKGRSACGGDSGGGFITDRNERKQVVSVVSAGVDCIPEMISHQLMFIDENTDVYTHMPWICKQTGLCDEKDYPQVNKNKFNGNTLIIESNTVE